MRVVQTISLDDTVSKFGPGSTVVPTGAIYQQNVKLYPARSTTSVDYSKVVQITLPPISPANVAFFYITAPALASANGACVFFSTTPITTRTGMPFLREDYLLSAEQSALVYKTGSLYLMLDDDLLVRPQYLPVSLVVGAKP